MASKPCSGFDDYGGVRMRLFLSAVTTAAVLGLAACSGGGDPEPSPSRSVDADGFSPEQREAADAVVAYYELTGKYEAGDRSVDFTDVLTEDEAGVVEPLIADAFEDQKTLGAAVFDPTEVTVEGDTATVTGCRDASGTVTVPADTPEDAVTVPTPTGEGKTTSLPVVQTPDGWRVSSAAADPDEEDVPCTVSS